MGAGFKAAGSGLLVVLALALAAPQAGATTTGCRGGLPGTSSESPPVELPGSLEAPVLGSYALFRRPAQPADTLPPVNSTGGELEGELSGYYASEIRQVAALPDGRRFFVIPGLPRVLPTPPLSCFPKSLRKEIAKENEEALRRQSEPRYCVVETGSRRGLSGNTCVAFADVAKSEQIFGLSLIGPATEVALVPDGVASVRIVGPGTRRVTIPVSENAYLYTAPNDLVAKQRQLLRSLLELNVPKNPTKAQRQRLRRRVERTVRTIVLKTEAGRIEWLGPGGALIRSIAQPRSFDQLVGGPISTG